MVRGFRRWAREQKGKRIESIAIFLAIGFALSRLTWSLIPMSESNGRLVVLIGVATICVVLSGTWASSTPPDPKLKVSAPVRLALALAFSIGWILDIPSQHIERQWLRASPASVVIQGSVEREGQTWLLHAADQPRTVRLLVPTELVHERIHSGDVAVVAGRALSPVAVRNPGSFDERTWMKQKGWALNMEVGRIHVVHDHKPRTGRYAQWQLILRSRIDTRFEDENVRALVRAMILADRSALNDNLESSFRRVGLMHLLAVSGLHFGCLILGVWLLAGSIASRIPVSVSAKRITITGLVLLAAVGYASLVGWSPSVVRAFLMLSVTSLCHIMQRRGWIERSLLMSALFIAFVEPGQWYSVGTQLSFAAVTGITLGLRFDRWTTTSTARLRWPFQSAIIISSAAFLGTLPVLLWHMGWVPLVGLLVSPPAVALTAATLLLAIATIALPVGGHAVGILASKGFSFIVWLADLAGAIDLPRLVAHSAADVVAALILVGAFLTWILPGLRLYSRVCATVLLVSIAVLIWMRPEFPRLTMLDVGQGDALILEGRGFVPVVIDTGPSVRSGRVIAGALKTHGHNRARVILSHGDRDHIGGLKSLVDDMLITSIMTPWTQDDFRDVRPIHLSAGLRLDLPASMRGYVLHPDVPGRDNHRSMVVFIVAGRHGILLTGDVDERAEKSVIQSYRPLFEPLDMRILKVAHHGSITSTSEELLEQFSPDVALISAGRDNQFAHPDAEVLTRLESFGAVVHLTTQRGAIKISGLGGHIRIHGYHQGRWRRIQDSHHHKPESVLDENGN